MSLTPDPLSPVQTKVLELLLAGHSISEAARQSGVHRTTIHHWCRSQSRFRPAWEQSRAALASNLFDGLHDLAGTALTALRQTLENPDTPPSVRVRSALGILQAVNKLKTPVPEPPAPEEQELSDEQFLASLEAPVQTVRHLTPPPGRNQLCPCGSGVKYKRCCLGKLPAARAA